MPTLRQTGGIRLSLALFLLTFFPPLALSLAAESFRLPTANQAIFERGGEEKYFVGTVGKTWISGTFGSVRSEGWQIHEGLDIRCIQRDKRGEPIDPVMATAEGTVAYVNQHPSLSNYGNYIVLHHRIEGLDIFSLYAHLSAIRPEIRPGQTVKAGEVIGTMGRTSNTHEGISKERAHVHFEINLLTNDRYAQWHKKALADQRNDHGDWNGQNLAGIDARRILLEQHRLGDRFSLLNFIRTEPELCRVVIRSPSLAWAKRYPVLVKPNPVAEREGVAGYEVALDFNAVAIELIPRAASELRNPSKFALLSVNEAEQKRNPSRKLVSKKGAHWELTAHGLRALDLFSY